MSDRLSQLQTCLDQLVTQFFSALNYINTHHDFEPLSGEAKVVDEKMDISLHEKFTEDLQELSKDIVLKAKQIQTLIESLPGLDASQQTQMQALEDLEKELQAAHADQEDAKRERGELLELCNDLIMRITTDKIQLESEFSELRD